MQEPHEVRRFFSESRLFQPERISGGIRFTRLGISESPFGGETYEQFLQKRLGEAGIKAIIKEEPLQNEVRFDHKGNPIPEHNLTRYRSIVTIKAKGNDGEALAGLVEKARVFHPDALMIFTGFRHDAGQLIGKVKFHETTVPVIQEGTDRIIGRVIPKKPNAIFDTLAPRSKILDLLEDKLGHAWDMGRQNADAKLNIQTHVMEWASRDLDEFLIANNARFGSTPKQHHENRLKLLRKLKISLVDIIKKSKDHAIARDPIRAEA
ncbi:MAG: hypothetical protein AABX01_03295 [Candidatus Micrarchaeota archaeon]